MTVLEQLQSSSGGVIRGALSAADKLELEAFGYSVLLIDRAPVFNKETLLHGIYQAAMLPAYFGFNWDALEDSLSDFSWLPSSQGIVLVLQNAALLETRDHLCLVTLLEIISEVAVLRSSQKLVPLFLLV
jgi:hypothetical protein